MQICLWKFKSTSDKVKFPSVWFLPLCRKPWTVAERHRSCASWWAFAFSFVFVLSFVFASRWESVWWWWLSMVTAKESLQAIGGFQKFMKHLQPGIRWHQLLDIFYFASCFLQTAHFLLSFVLLPWASFASLVFVFEDTSGGGGGGRGGDCWL